MAEGAGLGDVEVVAGDEGVVVRRVWGDGRGIGLGLEVVGLVRNDEAHATGGVGDVAGVPGDEVDVEVRYGLAGSLVFVDADVVSVGVVLVVEVLAHAVEEGEEGKALLGGGVGDGGDVPAGDDEGVAGVVVAEGEGEVVLVN